jgi:hypothetical protein
MTTDYRALCAELHAAIQLYTGQNPAAAEIPSNQLIRQLMDAMAATATALAQPEPEGPTDEELDSVFHEHCWTEDDLMDHDDFVKAARAHPTPEPIPVSERLPGDQLCWWFEADEDGGYGNNWTLLRIRGSATGYTHWLPHWALPLPTDQ